VGKKRDSGFVLCESGAGFSIHLKGGFVLSLDKICKEVAMLKFQFIRLFNANTGISPYQYFIFCKVNRAKQLLEKNKDIYSAIADCGFILNFVFL